MAGRMMSVLLPLLLVFGVARAETVHHETFSDGIPDLTWISAWGESADQIEVDYLADNPSGDGFVGKLGNALSGGGVGTLLVNDPTLADYTISAHVYLVPNTTHYRGIVGRAHEFPTDTTSTWEFYAFVADLSEGTGMGDQRLMLRRWSSTGMTNIYVWTIGELGALYPSTMGWYNLSMTFEGDQITCAIDGQELPGGPRTDSNIADGGFGVYYFDFMDDEGHLFFDDVLVDVETVVSPIPLVPGGLSLGQPWPNPFNPVVRVDLHLGAAAYVEARVHDLAGRLVRTLADGPMAAGGHTLVWDGTTAQGGTAASGAYLLNVDDGRSRQTRRLSLLR